MKNIIKKRKNNRQEDHKIDKKSEFEIDDDVVNIGYWLIANHNDYFTGSYIANLRFVLWLIYTIIVLGCQTYI